MPISSVNPFRNNSIQLNTQISTPAKQTSNANFNDVLRSGLATGASMANNAVNLAAPQIPGAATMTAALSDAANNLLSQDGDLSTGLGAGQSQDIRSLQSNMIKSNEEMLAHQWKTSQISNAFTAKSNIMKTLQETTKSVIANFR